MFEINNIGGRLRIIAFDAMLTAAAMLMSYVESFVPLMLIVPIPGIKLGLANLAVMAAAFDISRCGAGIFDAAAISAIRIFLTAFMFGSVTTLWFSAVGGLASLLILALCRTLLRERVSYIGTAVLCAAAHNAGQILAAVLLFGDASLFNFMPWLLIVSIVTGLSTGFLLYMIAVRVKRSPRGEYE